MSAENQYFLLIYYSVRRTFDNGAFKDDLNRDVRIA